MTDTPLLDDRGGRAAARARDRRRGRGARGRAARAPAGSRRRASARTRAAFREAVERVSPALLARPREGRALRGRREGRLGARSRARGGWARGRRRPEVGPEGCDAAVDFTRPDAVLANVERCLAAGVPVVIGTSGFDADAVRRASARGGRPVLLRAELRARRGADDALRGGGGADVPARGDRRAAQRGEARRAFGHGEGDGRAHGHGPGDPLDPAARASSRTRRSSSAGRGRRSRSATTRSRARRSCRASCSRSSGCATCRRA